ncbi:MAG: hypothetical protein M1812_001827 [Candelaria pacifica]|nr:MAG: hypothetical protein M1812_001827 [Candelaria pacifica]
MRFSQAPPTLLSLLAIILTSAHSTTAKPYPRDESSDASNTNILEERVCAIPCGWNGLCCAQGQTCTTDSSGQPLCGSGGGAVVATTALAQAAVSQAAVATTAAPVQTAAGGQWQYYTSTWIETNLVTRTSVYSSFIGATAQQAPATTYQVQTTAVAGAGTASCNYALNETPCGNICCSGQQHCMSLGQCAAGAGGSSNNNYNTQTISAAIRPTTVQTVTTTATTTGPFQTTVPTGTSGSSLTGASAQSNNGLSGGAIAGIVIGVIAGIILLLLLLAACCFKAGIDGLLALFGLGGKKRRRTEETYVEERYSHHGGGGSGGRRWYGGGGPSRPERPQKSGGVGGLGAVGAGLAALAVILGLKRRQGRNEKSSFGSGSSYTYSTDYTSSMQAQMTEEREIRGTHGASIWGQGARYHESNRCI